MNCIKDGHTSNYCEAEMMCPYCAEAHPEDLCKLRGIITSNCTACARALKNSNDGTDLKTLFSTTPVQLHHSPLIPTCPTRITQKKSDAKKANTPADKQPSLSGTPTVDTSAKNTEVGAPGVVIVSDDSPTPVPEHFNAGANNTNMTSSQC